MTDQQYRHFERKDFYNSHHSVIAKHQDAMTGESLHGKADIAMELAFRDIRIAELEQVARKAETLYNNIGTHSSSRKWVDQKHVDDLGFALCDINES